MHGGTGIRPLVIVYKGWTGLVMIRESHGIVSQTRCSRVLCRMMVVVAYHVVGVEELWTFGSAG